MLRLTCTTKRHSPAPTSLSAFAGQWFLQRGITAPQTRRFSNSKFFPSSPIPIAPPRSMDTDSTLRREQACAAISHLKSVPIPAHPPRSAHRFDIPAGCRATASRQRCFHGSSGRLQPTRPVVSLWPATSRMRFQGAQCFIARPGRLVHSASLQRTRYTARPALPVTSSRPPGAASPRVRTPPCTRTSAPKPAPSPLSA